MNFPPKIKGPFSHLNKLRLSIQNWNSLMRHFEKVAYNFNPVYSLAPTLPDKKLHRGRSELENCKMFNGTISSSLITCS